MFNQYPKEVEFSPKASFLPVFKFSNFQIISSFLIIYFWGFAAVFSQQSNNILTVYENNPWVDSVFNSLTEDERIGQLFMIAAYSNRSQNHIDSIARFIQQYKIGGLIFFQGGPMRQVNLTNYYQSIAKVPLLISIDAENGLSMRLDSTISFPNQISLGAMQNDTLIYQMGKEIGSACKRMGIHINFAPVVDINTNPQNPVINYRSFGENKKNVSKKSIAYMKGLHKSGILAVGKHFPGHGDTDSDSHKTLPSLNHSKERLDTLELFPFKKLIESGLAGIMTAHLYIPAYDTALNVPASLSHVAVSDVLQNQLGYNGLIFTDALNMKGVASYYNAGDIEVKAILAGNDILLFPQDISAAFKSIKTAIKKGDISQQEIDRRVKKILAAKYWVGLNNYKPIETKNLYEDLNSNYAKLLSQQLYEESITLLQDNAQIIPFKRLDTLSLATVCIGPDSISTFQNIINKYTLCKHFNIKKNELAQVNDSLLSQLSGYDAVVVSLLGMSKYSFNNYGISNPIKDFIEQLNQKTKVILVILGNPYSLKYFPNQDPVIMAFEDNITTQSLSAQILFGGIASLGKLPITASRSFRYKDGTISPLPIRLKYSFSEEVNINSKDLDRIDSIAMKAIKSGAAPGCQILVAKDGKVIYEKSFGYHTYENKISVKNDDLYDIASITKIASSLLIIMKLVDLELLDVNKPLSHYMDGLRWSNKRKLVIREILAHQAGLLPWIPFWMETINKDGSYNNKIYSKTPDKDFTIQVADSLYISKEYEKEIYKTITKSKLKHKSEPHYSDLGFYMLKKVGEELFKEPFDSCVETRFFSKLGINSMCFNPRKQFSLEQIVPTENDTLFRKQLIHGYVHDPGAAMLGGVSGHAGLFGNANSLAIIMQMLLQGGEYGGEKFLKKETIEKFTAQQFPDNRRGIGFDKPEIDPAISGPTAKSASYKSFGHSGFTGTCVWADPEHNLIYVFLSNRVHPDAGNNKLINMNVRTDIHQVIYDAINNRKKN